MSSKLVVFCLAIAAVSALPLDNNGYTYTEGVSGSLDTSASGVNYVQTVQPQSTQYVQTTKTNYVQPQVVTNYVQPQASTQYVQTTKTNYVQPQVATVTTNYVQPQASTQYVQTTKTNYVQPQVSTQYVQTGSQYVQPQASSQYVQTSGSRVVSDSPSVLIEAASVGVPYVKSAQNNYVEQNYNQEIQYSQPIISKSFYTFSGPEDHDEKTAVHHITVGKPQKNYRVIFIKNPSSSVNKALIKAHIAPTEEKTVVYVLSKNQNELNIESEVDEVAPTQPSKPEVIFVKYRTPEEIRHLQETVQNQYNVLGGVNQVSDEGFAPVRSVIGALGGASEVVETTSGNVGIGGGSYTSGSVGGSNTYTSGSVGGSNTYTSGSVGSVGSNTYTSGSVGSVGSNTYTTGSVGLVGGSNTLVSGTVGAGGISYFENGAAASTGVPQYTTTTTQQKVYLPPSISSRVDSISEEDQGRELSRVIKSTAKLHALAHTDKDVEDDVTVVEEKEEST